MKLLNLTLVAAVFVAGALVSNTALAHGRGRVGVGVVIGAPLWGPWYYPPPRYYYYDPYPYPYPYAYPRAAVSPPAYIEKDDQAPGSSGDWYYCADSKAYYPYVKECPGGWQRVAPQPPSTR